ncbi:MAG: hypothetical protein BGO07_01560 [Alphaproteobacteria bacterium 40-19]|nr:MAG: hypothetical protein BGO07_01560 [Alphaproteobacteria bacterium 40-19]
MDYLTPISNIIPFLFPTLSVVFEGEPMFYYAWIEENEDFKPEKHLRQDELVIKFEVEHKEAQPCQLKMTVPLKKELDSSKKWLILSYHDSTHTIPLFKGQLEEYQNQEKFTEMRFKAMATNDGWKEISETVLRHTPYYNFFHKDTTPAHLLDTHPYVLYWSRLKGKCFLSHVTKGRKKIDLSEATLAGSEHYEIFEGVQTVNLNIKAKWRVIQEVTADIFPAIARKFSSDYIESYTATGLKRSWPKTGTFLGRSGYRIIHSEIKEDEFSCLYIPKSQKENEKKAFLKKRFKGSIMVSKAQAQKREEIAHSKINVNQTGKILDLEFSLRRLSCNPKCWIPFAHYKKGEIIHYKNVLYVCKKENCAQHFNKKHWEESTEWKDLWKSLMQKDFFRSFVGSQLFFQGVRKMEKIILQENCTHHVRSSFCNVKALTVTLDDAVSLSNPKSFTGKVTEYRLKADALGWKVDLVLKGMVKEKQEKEILHFEGFEEKNKGESKKEFSQELPKEDLLKNLENFIHQISVLNSAQDQEAIFSHAEKTGKEIGLQDLTTKIFISFCDLKEEKIPLNQIVISNKGTVKTFQSQDFLEKESSLFETD